MTSSKPKFKGITQEKKQNKKPCEEDGKNQLDLYLHQCVSGDRREREAAMVFKN
jgi:hypothetical protein